MTSSNKENDSCSSDDEIHKVFRQNRTRSVVSPESDDENSHSDAENKSKQKKTLQKKCESDSSSNSNVSPPISQADDSSKNETKPDSDQKSPKEISDGEQSEKCAICLSKFLDQQIASPETCDHKFCSECILEWAKKMNTCPIDRLRFRYVFIQNREKPELRERVPVDEQWHRSVQAAEYIYLNTCQLCSQGENLVACIGCSRSYHAACLHMPPDQVEWHCPHCTFQERLSHTNVRMSERYRAMCRFNPRLQIPFEQRNRVMAEFFGVPADLPTRQSQFLASNENDSSSEDSTDESDEELSSSTERQHQCEAVRNRRQTRYSERMRARVLNTLSNRPALVTHNPSEPFYAPNDSSDDSDYGYQDSGGGGGGVVSTVPPRSASLTQLLDRNKCFVSSTLLDYPLPALRPMPRPGEDSDIVDNFRILEDLHPRSNMNTPVPLSRKENDVGRQHPGNPAQNSTSGSGNSRSTFPSSSSSSATSGSSLYGLFSTPGDSMLTSNAAAEGYDTDASPVATHHSYGNTSQQSSSKKDAQESVHVKDIQKSHSDDEVDIYSDIEYANDENSIDTDVLQLRASYKSEASSHLQSHGTADENSLDTDMMQLQSSYKSDEPHSSPVGDGTDSSDNDLVIDEDVAAEEEAKNNADKESSDISHENAVPGSENSCGSSSAENCEPSSEPNMPENIQSPDPSENVNHESDWPANNESEESVDHVPGNKLNFEMKLYVDTDADSRDIQCADDEEEEEDHKDEDHSQNSFESKSENQGPKSPINDNSLSPHKDDGDVVMADGDVSTDNLTEYFQETLPTEKNEDSAIEMNSDDKQVETDDLMNETNSVHKSDDSDEEEEEDCDNKAEEDEKECESDDNECVNNSSTPEYRSSPTNCLSPKGQNSADGMSSSFNSSKTFANSTTPFFTENPTTGLKEFPTKASLKECLPIEGEFETKEHREKNNNYQNIDLGIEDISDAASDDLNQLDNDTPEPVVCGDTPDATMCDVEKNVAKLFEPEDMESSPTKHNRNHRNDDYGEGASDDSKRYAASYRQDLIEDQEEGEIIEDIPYQRKSSHRRGHFIHDDEDYGDSAPRINISDLPRIPKIRRETKPDIPEEPLLETKRTSVLGRVDLGQADIGWKRLSKHTRERSYRDGRPKDETILFRERELKSRDRNKKHPSRERKNEQKPMEPERRKEDKKPNSDKSRDRSKDHSRDRRSEKSKSDHERSKSEWSYSEKRDKEKHSKHKDRHDRDKTRKERHESKKDRHEKSKDKSRREDSKHRQEKLRAEDKYAREVERFHQKEESYERMYEKPREKEHKHKHKESKSDSGKKCKDEKHKRTHSREYFFEKREREVRKVDDKLKIVVEHKESRSKDRNEKLTEKRDFKHEKKHREVGHHHERKKKELSPVSYTELTPIESKEIFAKGDSIIINVNFNRASPREVVPPGSEEFNRDKKSNSGDLIKGDSESHNSKLAHSSLDSDKKNDLKCPTTPLEKNSQLLSTDEYYWQGGDEANVKSSVEEKGSSEKARSINDESSNSPVNNFGADDNVTDSEDEDNLPETQPNPSLLPKDDELDLIVLSPEKGSDKNQTFRESEEKEFGSSRQRSPLHPPSPPSPPDNDSYDPCEPTKSPSPPPPPVPPSPPLPPIGMTSDRPKPPPSPELPPLPPEPEPTDTAFLEDGKSNAQGHSLDSVNSIRSSPVVTQPTEHHGPLTTESVASAPGTLLPPPRFLGHVSHQNVSNMQSQLTPSKTWQATNPPPSTVIFQSNHMQPVMPGNFLPAHIPTVGFPPPHVSATVLPSNSSIPLTSQVRHMQLGPHSVVPTNTLLPNVPMNHMTLPQVQISHVNPPLPNPSVSAAMHQQHHPVIAMQAHAGNLPNSMASHISGIMPIQNQLASNATVTLHGQHGNLISAHHPQSVAQLYPPQNHQTLPPTSLKEKLPKSSPAKDRSEVIDMDVDSPYSPGDSPSMDSAYDYSPPSSPVYQDNNPVAAVKDAFDSLFAAEQASGSQVEKTSSKGHSHSNSGEREHKKQKLDSKTESGKSRHHSVRLQVVDKVKSRKEHKLSERKDVLTKLDDSQLTILDELPSSAVEMQVKEKFLKKLNRQERVVEEVKLALKPYYKTREVSKEEYKDILRKSVPKICHNKSGEINPQKVKYFVDCYVKKMKHHRKKASKKRKSSKFS